MSSHDPGRSHERHHLDGDISETRHDPYQERHKPREPAACPECGAVFHQGRWQWTPAPADAVSHLCPACRRTREKFPAGVVTLEGEFLRVHRAEILHLARNQEIAEKQEHPLQRIIEIVEGDETVTVTTTDLHLARRIGDAIHHAYQGTLDIKYSPDEYLVRILWRR